MTQLQLRMVGVRRTWRQTEAMKGLAVVLADAVITVLALVAVDAVYHLPAWLRAALLGVGLAALLAAAFVAIVRPLRRAVSQEDIALHVEGRFPQLQGTLAAAVEYEPRQRDSKLQGELVDALVADCLTRAARLDLGRAVDRRRLARRGLAAGVLLAFFLGAAAVKPGFFRHELVRVLTPWRPSTMSAEELAASERRRQEDEDRRRLLRALQGKDAAPVEIKVTPGDTDIVRGRSVRVQAAASRITGPMTLKFRTTAGEWRSLPMPEDPAQPEKFAQVLQDVTENMAYQVVIKGGESAVFRIRVIDPATVKHLTLTYKYPKYTLMPDKTVTGMDGSIEAVEGTRVLVTLAVTTSLRDGSLRLDDGRVIPMTVRGSEATGSLPIDRDGDYAIRATDAMGLSVDLPLRYAIRALKDEPPELEVVHPGIDSLVHPMEEVIFAARSTDAIGLKEMRLHAYYNLGKEEVFRIGCIEGGRALTEKLAEFLMDLETRKPAQAGDTILYHIEAEDTKGQVAASDVYTAAVRKWETWLAYGHPGHAGAPHGYGGPDLINVIGAAWNLQTKRKALSEQKLNRESEKIGRALESK